MEIAIVDKINSHIMAEQEQPKIELESKTSEVILAESNQALMAGTLEALQYLRDTIKDTTAPHTVRERCADSLLDRAGIVRQKAKDTGELVKKSLESMDLRDLEKFIKNTQKTITAESKAAKCSSKKTSLKKKSNKSTA